ncbi:MAG: ATP-binding protein [Spirochaetales bacterium]|nr:ATP-binding protein [Spirochaetales bacterium]
MIDPDAPVTNPDDFFGRTAIIRRIFSRIGAERPQSIAIIGGRKSGKTSIINYIFNEKIRNEHLKQPDNYIFYLMHSQEHASERAEHFISKIIGSASPDMEPDTNQYATLQKIVQDIHQAGKKLILLLDDFHFVTGNKEFPLEFFSFLRSLANNYNVAYVTTSFLELQKLCVAKDIEESPFFNIFTNFAIGPLSVQNGAILLQTISGIEKEVADNIISWAGPIPYMIKLIACGYEKNPALLQLDENHYEQKLLPVISPYFEEILTILPKEASSPLKHIAKGRQPDQKDVHLLRPLIRHGFLVEDDELLSPFSPAFLAFLKRNPAAGLFKGQKYY